MVRGGMRSSSRREGLEQARRQDRSGTSIVVGFAIVEGESWVICGYDPQHEAESAENRDLGFDPRLRSHELTACKDDNAPRSPKRVLQVLSGGDRDHEHRCWMEIPLEVLRERGRENGLAAYLDEVRTRLAPLICHVPEG